MPRCCGCCCGCCSLRCIGALVLLCALIPTVVNPVLDALIADPLPVKDPSHVYVEGKTDITNYSALAFVDPNTPVMKAYLPPTWFVGAALPRWVLKLLSKWSSEWSGVEGLTAYCQDRSGRQLCQFPNVTFLDARGRVEDYAKRGFTLHKMPRLATDAYRTNIQPYMDDVEVLVKQLHPDVKTIQFTYPCIRGGSKLFDQPVALNSPHVDYTQNDTARTAFHKEYPPFPGADETPILLGEHDTPDKGTFKIMLGIWKPVYMKTPVCDHPLAIMDASTFRPEHERLNEVKISLGVAQGYNLGGAIVHDPAQRWYYYSHQTEEEVLVFRHYTRDRFFATPHTSFLNTNCPEGAESRQSVELRVALFF